MTAGPSARFGVRAGAPSHLSLKMVARPAPGLTIAEVIEKMDDRGEDYEVRPEGIVVADEVFVNGLYLDHSEAAQGEAVWACEFCGSYSRTKAVVEQHETECNLNLDLRP